MATTQTIERTCYQEAMRYITLAKELLQKAGKMPDGKYYDDVMYVKSAAGVAYIGVEVAAKCLIAIKEPNKKINVGNNSNIASALGGLGGNFKQEFGSVYNTLHLNVYYRNEKKVQTVRDGIESAIDFISHIEPYKNAIAYADGGIIKGYPNHIYIGTLKDFKAKSTKAGHDSVAICTCGDFLTYKRNDDAENYTCPHCHESKPIQNIAENIEWFQTF